MPNTHADTADRIAHMSNGRAHAIIARMPTTRFYAATARRQIDLVMKQRDVFGGDFVEAGSF